VFAANFVEASPAELPASTSSILSGLRQNADFAELRSIAMPDVKALEKAVQDLPPSALAEFRPWFADFDAAAWDGQLEADASNGKLDPWLAQAVQDCDSLPHRFL
jgi:hypothetical protein